MKSLPKRLLTSKYRKQMWETTQAVYKDIAKALPISEVHVVGSFTTKKKRPADVDYMILLKTPKHKNKKWCIDLAICPDNKFGKEVVKDAQRWAEEKYGKKKCISLRIQ